MFIWTNETIQFYKDAAQFNKYHEVLRGMIAPFIAEEDHVLDLGCGLGFLSLELAQICEKVTAIDHEERVLHLLQEGVTRKNIANIHVQKQIWEDISHTAQWDVVLASFFGKLPEDMDKLLQMCKKRVIVISSNGSSPEFLPNTKKRLSRKTTREAVDILQDTHRITHYEEGVLEFGQPFKTKDEAFEFVAHYREEVDEKMIKRHLEKYLVAIDEVDFSFYLPNQKNIGIYVVEKDF